MVVALAARQKSNAGAPDMPKRRSAWTHDLHASSFLTSSISMPPAAQDDILPLLVSAAWLSWPDILALDIDFRLERTPSGNRAFFGVHRWPMMAQLADVCR